MWDYDSLWKKARVFMKRALSEEDRDGEVFPLWASFSLEMLCRASLAKVHPALLADAKDGTDNILHACGYSVKEPKSIPMRMVVTRCQRICQGFTEREANFCKSMSDRRNEDLHSGSMPFASVKHTDWLGEFYRVCNILLDQQRQPLEDFLGNNEGYAAREMIAAVAADRKAEAYRLVAEAKAAFAAVDGKIQHEALRTGEILRKKDGYSWGDHADINCPACGGPARLYGKLINQSRPRDDEGELVQDHLYLPIRLQCFSCQLAINGHEFLHGIGLGAQFKKTIYLDPVDHFGIDPSEYGWYDERELEKMRTEWIDDYNRDAAYEHWH